MVQAEQRKRIEARAAELAEDRLVALLSKPELEVVPAAARGPFLVSSQGTVQRPEMRPKDSSELRASLRSGALDDELVDVEVQDASNPLVSIFGSGHGMEEMENQLKDLFNQMPGMRGRKQKRRLKVKDARRVLEDDEAQKLIDMDAVRREAVERAQQSGIVFLDEIDKIAGQRATHGPDISREGVQRDLLPIVEGSTVNTKYGAIKTDHILFIAAGAFHVSSVSDLIPELQGRFPIRVELEALRTEDFVRILKEPHNALTRQYAALMAAEGIELSFSDAALEAIAEFATRANQRAENIGARRLHTVMEALLEKLSFEAPERVEKKVRIDRDDVVATLSPILADEDLARFIL
jgi:ATP-dependent HslUV protease ATP-binding subunit HslU